MCVSSVCHLIPLWTHSVSSPVSPCAHAHSHLYTHTLTHTCTSHCCWKDTIAVCSGDKWECARAHKHMHFAALLIIYAARWVCLCTVRFCLPCNVLCYSALVCVFVLVSVCSFCSQCGRTKWVWVSDCWWESRKRQSKDKAGQWQRRMKCLFLQFVNCDKNCIHYILHYCVCKLGLCNMGNKKLQQFWELLQLRYD